MSTTELLEYVRAHVPAYVDPMLTGPGVGFHYTTHSRAILDAGYFLGQPIGPRLHATQADPGPSSPALDPHGVVFLFPDLASAILHGKGQDIFQVQYHSGVIAVQQFEAAIRLGYGLINSPDILVLAPQIAGFSIHVSEEKTQRRDLE
jgi:hypothetical protein